MPEHEPGLTPPPKTAPVDPRAPRRLTYGDQAETSPATAPKKRPKR